MAKLGIALGSGPRDLGFESRHSDQRNRNPLSRVPAFAWVKGGFEQSNGAARWAAPCRRLDGGNTMILIPKGIRMQRIPTLRPQKASAAAGAFFIPCTLRLRKRLHAYTLYTRIFGSVPNENDSLRQAPGRRAASQCVTNAGRSTNILDHERLRINGMCWFVAVGAAIGRPQRWAWYALRFDGKAQNIGTFRAAQWPPLQWHMDCCKLQFGEAMPSPGGRCPRRGRMRALSVTAKAVPAPPMGGPSLAALSKVVSSVWG